MGRIITQALRAGAERFVRGFAAEAAGITPAAARKSTRSLMSQAIAHLRREFPILEGSRGYEAARNVYRRAVRTATRTKREAERQAERIDRGLPPVDSRPPDARPPPMAEYTLTVKLASNRSERTFWTTVRVRAPAGLAYSEVAARARSEIDIEDVTKESGDRRRNGILKTHYVAEFVVLSESPLFV